MANVALPGNYVVRRLETGVFVVGRQWTAPANLSVADTLDFAKVPVNGRLLGIKAKSDTAIAGTIDIGDGTTVDRFLDGSNAMATADLVAEANEDIGEVLSASAEITLRITFLTAAPAQGDIINAWALVTMDPFTIDSGPAA